LSKDKLGRERKNGKLFAESPKIITIKVSKEEKEKLDIQRNMD